MPDDRTYGFSRDDASELISLIGSSDGFVAETRPSRQSAEIAVILDADLSVATNAKTGAASCLATICEWDVSVNDYVETAEQITVWNHSESQEYAENTFGFARVIQSHWVFSGDCEAMVAR